MNVDFRLFVNRDGSCGFVAGAMFWFFCKIYLLVIITNAWFFNTWSLIRILQSKKWQRLYKNLVLWCELKYYVR